MGLDVGVLDGVLVGVVEGVCVDCGGFVEGDIVGPREGEQEGDFVGVHEGVQDGTRDGVSDGGIIVCGCFVGENVVGHVVERVGDTLDEVRDWVGTVVVIIIVGTVVVIIIIFVDGCREGVVVGMDGTFISVVRKLVKFTDPNPVTGSQPGVASNPWAQQI